VLLSNGAALVTKAAIEPVWYLPGVAQRFGCSETELRRALSRRRAACNPELVTRSDLEVFLPPIGGQTLYIFGAARDLADPDVELTARVHDECNGSDVFGSDICTCRRTSHTPSKNAFRVRNAAASAWSPTPARRVAHSAR